MGIHNIQTVIGKMKNKKRIALYLAILAVLLIGIVLLKNKSFLAMNNQDTPTTVASNKVSVEVEGAKAVEKTSDSAYKATLEAYREGIVSSKLSAKVVQILFEEGNYVSQGDPLLVLDDQDVTNQLKAAENKLTASQNQLAASQAALKKLEANLAIAQRNYEQGKILYENGAGSLSGFQDAEAALKAAKAETESGEVSIETAKTNIKAAQIDIDTLRDALANTVIKAPISGVMDGKNVSLGQMASPGTTLAKVKDISTIKAIIQVEQENINTVKVGDKAIINLDESKDSSYEGVVESMGLSADPQARVFDYNIRVDNPSKELRPGTYALVQISGGQKERVVTVPLEALGGTEENYYVFVNENDKAGKRRVTIGDTLDNTVEIKSGIQAGDSIICTSVGTLYDGEQISAVAN